MLGRHKLLRFSQISAEADNMHRVMVMDLNFKITDVQHKLSSHLCPATLMPHKACFQDTKTPIIVLMSYQIWDILSSQKDFLAHKPHNIGPHMGWCAASQMEDKVGDLGMLTLCYKNQFFGDWMSGINLSYCRTWRDTCYILGEVGDVVFEWAIVWATAPSCSQKVTGACHGSNPRIRLWSEEKYCWLRLGGFAGW